MWYDAYAAVGDVDGGRTAAAAAVAPIVAGNKGSAGGSVSFGVSAGAEASISSQPRSCGDDDGEFDDVVDLVGGDTVEGGITLPSATLVRSVWELGLQDGLHRKGRRRRHGEACRKLLSKVL